MQSLIQRRTYQFAEPSPSYPRKENTTKKSTSAHREKSAKALSREMPLNSEEEEEEAVSCRRREAAMGPIEERV